VSDVPSWREVIAAVAGDRDSGSWAIARRAANGVSLAAAEGEAALREATRQLLAGQPAMAALWNLANAVAWAWTETPVAGERRVEAVMRAVRDYVARGDEAAGAISAQAAALLRAGGAARAVTISNSSVVASALAAWGGPVLVLESRPRCEGRTLARLLAAQGVAVALAVDAAARVLLERGDAILLGADAVCVQGISNKIGSWTLAAAARDRRLPVYALAGSEKWWPQPLAEPAGTGEAQRDPREVLPEPLPGVAVRNPYFETVPFALVTAVVTSEGPCSPRAVRARLARWRIHPWLRQLHAPAGPGCPS